MINRIKTLLAEDTDQSVTYAALEARLALEKFCYDRLRQRHDYISNEELGRWQPRAVINKLMKDVDKHVADSMKFMISRGPAVEGVDPDDDDFVEIGTEVGFDPKVIASMWNALGNLALHVELPKTKDDHIRDYGDKAKIRAKVDEVITELERLATGTMTFSGVPAGGDCSFECTCGSKNKRRATLLRNGQHVYCINPDCDETWKVEIDGGDIGFENVLIDVPCQNCGTIAHLAWRKMIKMKYNETLQYPCHECGAPNIVGWKLMHATKQDPSPDKS